MSEPVTALGGATAEGIAKVTEVGPQGMITLRGDLAHKALAAAARTASGADMPGPGQANVTGESGICWMSPDEVLVLCPYVDVDDTVAAMRAALKKVHALAVDVSDARAVFLVEGAGAREVLAKLAPVDLHPDVFKPGMFRRSRLAQAPAAFWMRDAETFQIVCFRSHAQYVFDLLKTAADSGSEVGFFPAV